jgi:periplasmic protein TonB
MFEAAPAARPRPLFAVSAAAHAALAAALVVPPLFATQEPPEPDGYVQIDHVPPLATDGPARETVVLLRKGNGGGAKTPSPRATDASASSRPRATQPRGVSEVLPPSTGGDPELPFEETGERSEPLVPGGGGGNGAGGEAGERCEGCSAISAEAPGVTPPAAIETAAPAYPELARRAHMEGVVVLEAVIGADGSVRDVHVLRGVSPLLDAAALDAVRRWRYRAASIDGRPVAVYLKVVLTFSLRNL